MRPRKIESNPISSMITLIESHLTVSNALEKSMSLWRIGDYSPPCPLVIESAYLISSVNAQ